jgi:hypothetical protein
MPRNQKLTKVIAGRTVKAITPAPGGVLILFDDESSMKIKTASAAAVLRAAMLDAFMKRGTSSESSSRTVLARPYNWRILARLWLCGIRMMRWSILVDQFPTQLGKGAVSKSRKLCYEERLDFDKRSP